MRQLRWFLVGLFVLAVLLVPARAARSDSPAQCTASTVQGGDGTLHADVRTNFNYDVPEGVSSVSGSATVQGSPSWGLDLNNFTPDSFSNPTIAIATGYDPSVFDGGLPLSGSCSLSTLASGQDMRLWNDLSAPGVQDDFSLGYDSSISGPTVIPPGGGLATESFTVTVTDPRYLGGWIDVGQIDNGAVQVVSLIDPTNVDQGETVSEAAVNNNLGIPDTWRLTNFQPDKPYVFTAVVQVQGDARGPSLFQPFGTVGVATEAGPPVSPGSSVTLSDPSIDGSFTFSVDSPGVIQEVSHEIDYQTSYPFLSPEREGDVTSTIAGSVPDGVDSVTSGSALQGTWSWNFDLLSTAYEKNAFVPSTVTTPSISVTSGYAPSQLDPNGGPPASSLPIVFSGPTVTVPGPKQPALSAFLGSTIAATLHTGCDTSRSVSPLVVPVGGGEQTVTLTARCTDPAVAYVDFLEQVSTPGATLVSFSGPSDGYPPDVPGDASAGLDFSEGVQTGTEYTFTSVIDVPNPYGRPFVDVPSVQVTEGAPEATGCSICSGPTPQTSVTLPVPTLDGPTPGAGSVTFSTGDAEEWAIGVNDLTQYTYGAVDAQLPVTKNDCKKGGWTALVRADGSSFNNQGDCIQYVNTGK